MILIPLFIIAVMGFLSVRLLVRNQITLSLQIVLGGILGFCLAGFIVFFQLVSLNKTNPLITIIISLIIIIILALLNQRMAFKPSLQLTKNQIITLVTVNIFMAIVLVLQATNFPLGGWDAWSCWNLKASFIFLNGDGWREIFRPELWRSNTHYPLLLPSIVTFGWQWLGSNTQSWPLACAVIFTLLTMNLISITCMTLGVHVAIAIGLSVLIFSVPFCTMLAISQYSDILVGLLTLAAFSTWLCARQNFSLKILCALFIGFLSFTKTEGLVAALLLAILLLIIDKECRRPTWFLALALSGFATLIFQLTMAPHNEAFINGLTATAKPTTLERLSIIAVYPWLEIINLKWQGLWLLLTAWLMINVKNAIRFPYNTIGIFILGYLGIVAAYYGINTFFEITWWLNTTLHRIIFALLPLFALWVGLASKK